METGTFVLMSDQPRLVMDKCTAELTLRVPQIFKDRWDALTDVQKKIAKERGLVEMGRVMHGAGYDPRLVLCSEFSPNSM